MQPSGYPQPSFFPQHPPPQPPPRKSGVGWIIALVVVVLLVPVLGIVATVGIYGVRRYISNAKTAEARNVLGQIGKAVVARYESTDRRLCPSASAPVPHDRASISGMKYQSAGAEWVHDEGRDAGFACLRIALDQPQYFQYVYEATATSFTARAYGDLDGDGVFTVFTLRGAIEGGELRIAPTLEEENPGE